jgi:hypothetical protein
MSACMCKETRFLLLIHRIILHITRERVTRCIPFVSSKILNLPSIPNRFNTICISSKEMNNLNTYKTCIYLTIIEIDLWCKSLNPAMLILNAIQNK